MMRNLMVQLGIFWLIKDFVMFGTILLPSTFPFLCGLSNNQTSPRTFISVFQTNLLPSYDPLSISVTTFLSCCCHLDLGFPLEHYFISIFKPFFAILFLFILEMYLYCLVLLFINSSLTILKIILFLFSLSSFPFCAP
jgi:hypothetical protein